MRAFVMGMRTPALIVGIGCALVTTKSMASFLEPSAAQALLPEPSRLEPSAAQLKYADLYGTQVRLLHSGEPLVRVGIAQGLGDVALRSAGAVVLRCDTGDGAVARAVEAGVGVRVRALRATAASQRYYLDLGVVSHTQRLASVLQGFRARGLHSVMPLFEGSVVGLGGRVLDNRSLRVVVPAADRADAKGRQQDIERRAGVTATLRPQLDVPPQGTLGVTLGQQEGPTFVCDNMLQVEAAGEAPVEVLDVEFAKGYSWHGHANRLYAGEIDVAIGPDGKLAVINEVGAETLLEGVVPAEIYASAPPEALKAQAVAARNTLFSKLGKRHTAEPFVLCGEQHCQVYAGVTAHDPRTSAAVAATRGEVLFLQGRLVDAVYSASCGGHTEDNETVWGDTPNPALRARLDMDGDARTLNDMQKALYARGLDAFWRGAPEAYCKRPTQANPERFRWRKVFGIAALDRIIKATHPEILPLRDVQVVGRGKGGRVMSLRLVGARHSVIIQRELPIRQLFENLNSAAFAVEIGRDTSGALQSVTFVGGGWGHGVGLCQLGAMGRAQEGQDYRRILSHYYSGAQTERLYP